MGQLCRFVNLCDSITIWLAICRYFDFFPIVSTCPVCVSFLFLSIVLPRFCFHSLLGRRPVKPVKPVIRPPKGKSKLGRYNCSTFLPWQPFFELRRFFVAYFLWFNLPICFVFFAHFSQIYLKFIFSNCVYQIVFHLFAAKVLQVTVGLKGKEVYR